MSACWFPGRHSSMKHTPLLPLTATLSLALLSLVVPIATQDCTTTHTVSTSTSVPNSQSCQCGLMADETSSQCQSLSDYLVSYNERIPQSDCLQLDLEPGLYTLSRYDIVLNFSAVIRAPQSGVTITCESLCGGEGDETVYTGTSPMAFQKSATGESFSVVLDGIEFQNCQRPLQFDDVDSIAIHNCNFRNFSESAVDLHNCWDVDIENCNFDTNTVSMRKAQFRANCGGLSIAYHTETATSRLPQVRVSGSTFTNNTANLPPQISSQQINLALNNNTYIGRGGGMGVFVDESNTNVTVMIEDCVFTGNYADSFGGGLYLYVNGNETYHEFNVTGCNFTGNSAGKGSFGGGIQVAFLIRNLQSPPCQFRFSNCFFVGNDADYGGGLSTVQVYSQGKGNNVSLEDSIFEGNTGNVVGSAVMFTSLLYIENRNQSFHYNVSDCSFTNNRSPGGTLGAGFVHIDFRGDILFQDNIGPGLRIVGSLISVAQRLSFIGNDARNHEGGALYISSFSQVKLYSGSEIEFINNTGMIGSAIVVNVQRSSFVFSQLIFNPQCFLIHENTTKPPDQWDDVSILFQGNRAQVGPVVYISHLDQCSWFSVEQTSNTTNLITATFSIDNFTDWAAFHYSDNDNQALAHDNPNSESYYFQTEAVRMDSQNYTNISFLIRPGQKRPLNLIGVDQFGNPTYFIVRFSDSRSNINSGAFSQAGDSRTTNLSDPDIVRFEPALLPIQPSDKVVNISYGFPSLSDKDAFRIGENINITVDTPYNVRDAKRFTFLLEVANCEPGYGLQRREGENLATCTCVDDDFFILTCDEEDGVIVLRDGVWAVSELHPAAHLHSHPCPIPYCSCHTRTSDPDQACETLFFQEDPDHNLQCHGYRRGTLCGECVNGTGVGVLRFNCRECSRDNYFALGFLIIIDAIIVVVILFVSVKLKYSFPHSLKGLLFYIQTVYYATEFFPSSFWNSRQFMLYLASALGLYFPWDFCLYPGMSALISFIPRFLPALTTAIMAIASGIVIHYCFGKRPLKRLWHGLWSLILLLYAPLFYTSVSLLHCPVLPGANGVEEEPRWFLDGEVMCFRDPLHAVLGMLAILVTITLSLTIPVLFFFILCGRHPQVQKYPVLERILGAVTEGYRETVRWWGAWELLRRLLLITILVALPGRSVASLFILIPAFALHVFLLPYKLWWQNLIEAGVLINYILLLLLRSTQTFLDDLANYSGTAVPASQGTALAEADSLTVLFAVFFYLPVVFGIIYCTAKGTYLAARWFYHNKARGNKKKFSVTSSHYGDFDNSTPTARDSGSSAVTVTELSVQTIY